MPSRKPQSLPRRPSGRSAPRYPRPFLYNLEIRPSRVHGQGVFTRTALPGRRKLGEVSGHLVRLPAARRQVEEHSQIYLVELTSRTALDCSRGNVFRCLNHSCSPNCYLRIAAKRVEVYSLHPIPKGTELTVDYGVTPHRNGMPCRCQSPRCRKNL
jgi:uncharacterized protein